MQPDPYVQDPLNLQNFERYAYCYNNPTTCTDPSGQLSLFGHKILPGLFKNSNIRIAAAIIVSIYLPGANGLLFTQLGIESAIGQAAICGFISGAITSGSLKGAIQGSYTAIAFAGVGDYLNNQGAFADSSVKGARYAEDSWQGVALHGVVGCVTSAAGGSKCGPGTLSASFSQASLGYKESFGNAIGNQFIGGVVSSMVIGGTASVLGGGKFANGAQTAAFGYLFNCSLHADNSVCTKSEIDNKVKNCTGSQICFRESILDYKEAGLLDRPLIEEVLKDLAKKDLELMSWSVSELGVAAGNLNTAIDVGNALLKGDYKAAVADLGGDLYGKKFGEFFKVFGDRTTAIISNISSRIEGAIISEQSFNFFTGNGGGK
jgi:hypothetical protein